MSNSSNPLSFKYKSHTTDRNLVYSYIHIPPSTPGAQHILFLHGFPSLAYDFHHQITHFSHLGYGILAPNLLGYTAYTSKPTSSDAYRLKLIAADLISLLDHESITTPVLGVGHDWGVPTLSRLEYYYPNRVHSMVFLTIGSHPFGQPFDLDMVNKMTAQMHPDGHAAFGYQDFFVRQNERAVQLLNTQRTKFHELMFTSEPMTLWSKYFGALGGLEEWLLERDGEMRQESKVVITEADLKVHNDAFDPDTAPLRQGEFGGGYAGPLCWYRSHVGNLNVGDEVEGEGYRTEKPVLIVLVTGDPIAVPDVHVEMTKPYAAGGLEIKKVDSGHWVMLEKPDDVNTFLQDFFEKSKDMA